MANRIYFVRHGETNANVQFLVQGPHEPLNEHGEAQALKLAKRAMHIDFEKLVASDFLRARQTAEAIAEAKHMEVEHMPLFHERVGPSRFFGRPNADEEFQAYVREEIAHKNDPDWHFEDAENHVEVIERARKALAYIKDLECEAALVVTHGLFLKYLVGEVIFGELFTPDVYQKLYWGISHTNTGITVCKFDEGMGRWRLLTWNDHSHFAE